MVFQVHNTTAELVESVCVYNSVSDSELCVVCAAIRGLLESVAAPLVALPVRLRASCAFSHTPLRHGVELVIIAIME